MGRLGRTALLASVGHGRWWLDLSTTVVLQLWHVAVVLERSGRRHQALSRGTDLGVGPACRSPLLLVGACPLCIIVTQQMYNPLLAHVQYIAQGIARHLQLSPKWLQLWLQVLSRSCVTSISPACGVIISLRCGFRPCNLQQGGCIQHMGENQCTVGR